MFFFVRIWKAAHDLLGIVGVRFVGCGMSLADASDRLCRDGFSTLQQSWEISVSSLEIAAAVFFSKPKEWRKQWDRVDWANIGVRILPDVPKAQADLDVKAGTGETVTKSSDRRQV